MKSHVTVQSSPGKAVSSGQDPLVVDQGASAEMAVVLVQTGLPGPRPRRSILTPYDSGVERRRATNWTETVGVHVSAWIDLDRHVALRMNPDDFGSLHL